MRDVYRHLSRFTCLQDMRLRKGVYSKDPVWTPAPIRLGGVGCYEKICLSYKAMGFALVELPDTAIDTVMSMARDLSLGEPYVPPQYHGGAGLYDSTGFNYIQRKDESVGDGVHRGFSTSQSQALHVDGTLEPIGRVRTSLLVCCQPAHRGGETRIFDAVGAVAYLTRYGLSSVAPLFDPECLRRSDVGRSQSSRLGPVFAFAGDELLTRFSVDNTSTWMVESVDGLQDSLEMLLECAIPGSGLFISFRLESRQCLLLANDRVAHGRAAYVDGYGLPRRMLRGLFLNRPVYHGTP